jgi:hypothetical protein
MRKGRAPKLITTFPDYYRHWGRYETDRHHHQTQVQTCLALRRPLIVCLPKTSFKQSVHHQNPLSLPAGLAESRYPQPIILRTTIMHRPATESIKSFDIGTG